MGATGSSCQPINWPHLSWGDKLSLTQLATYPRSMMVFTPLDGVTLLQSSSFWKLIPLKTVCVFRSLMLTWLWCFKIKLNRCHGFDLKSWTELEKIWLNCNCNFKGPRAGSCACMFGAGNRSNLCSIIQNTPNMMDNYVSCFLFVISKE